MYSKKKLVAFLVFTIMIIIILFRQTTKNVVINVRDDKGSPIAGAEIALSSYQSQEPILIARGVTNSKGKASMRSSIFKMSPDNSEVYYSYTLQVMHPLYGVVTENWSDKTKREKKNLELTFAINENMSQAFQKLNYQGSGIYRTKKIETIKTYENTVIGLLMCDSTDTDFSVKVEQLPGVEYDIQAKRQTIYPVVDNWEIAGQLRIVKKDNGNFWYNTAVEEENNGIHISTDFIYNQEVWEYQEQDKESSDIWHTRQRWVEVKGNSLHGSTMYGSMVKSDDNLILFRDLKKENGVIAKVDAKIPRSFVVDTLYRFSDACYYSPNIKDYDSVTPTTFDIIVHYNSSYIYTFGSRSYSNNRHVYDNGTNGAIWYVARE